MSSFFTLSAAEAFTLPIFPGIACALEWMKRMNEKVSSQPKQNSVREFVEGDTYSQDLQANFTHLQSFFHWIHDLTHPYTPTHQRLFLHRRQETSFGLNGVVLQILLISPLKILGKFAAHFSLFGICVCFICWHSLFVVS